MSVHFTNWFAALAITSIVMAMAIPRRILFDPSEWSRALQQHAWLSYLELPFYLAGILLVALVIAICGALVLRATRGMRALATSLTFVLRSGSLLGLSPLQPVLANVILILLVPSLAGIPWFPFEGLRWVFTFTLVTLFGLTLGCELALRAVERNPVGVRDWVRDLAQTMKEQSPALAGRLLVILMAGALIAGTTATMGTPPNQFQLGATRAALPVETIFVGVLAVLLSLAIWLVGRRVGGRPEHEFHQLPALNATRQLIAWVLVALAFIIPLAMLTAADDPLTQRVDRVQESPSAQHVFGTDALGRDVLARLAFAWRDTLFAGISIGIVLFGVGFAWRLTVPFDRSLLVVEAVIERLPPGALFFGVWGIVLGLVGDSMTVRSIAVASGVILLPTALKLLRIVDLRALPVAAFGLFMLGTLLVLGWSAVLGLIGMIQPPLPNFGEMLLQSREFRVEAPWIATYTALVLFVAMALPAMALAALSRCYGIPRQLFRLQG